MRSGRILHKIDRFLPRESQSRGAAGEFGTDKSRNRSIIIGETGSTRDCFHKGCVALFVGQYCMGFVALTALALFQPSRPACLRNG